MDLSLSAGVIQSLIAEKAGFTWTDRIGNERQDVRARGGGYDVTSYYETQPDFSPSSEEKKPGCGKRVTWDELVHVRQFEAFKEELKETYPRPYPYKHSNRQQKGQDNGQASSVNNSNNQQSQYLTSPTYDL